MLMLFFTGPAEACSRSCGLVLSSRDVVSETFLLLWRTASGSN